MLTKNKWLIFLKFECSLPGSFVSWYLLSHCNHHNSQTNISPIFSLFMCVFFPDLKMHRVCFFQQSWSEAMVWRYFFSFFFGGFRIAKRKYGFLHIYFSHLTIADSYYSYYYLCFTTKFTYSMLSPEPSAM